MQFIDKDPFGWQEFHAQLSEGSAAGHALTLRGVQMTRPSVFDLEPELVRLDVPTLIVTGDEDEPCLELALLMKRKIPTAGLVVLPESGRTINGFLTARPTPSTAPRTGCPWPRRGR